MKYNLRVFNGNFIVINSIDSSFQEKNWLFNSYAYLAVSGGLLIMLRPQLDEHQSRCLMIDD